MSELSMPKPKVRPTNLPPVTEFPNDPPVMLPSDTSDEATLAWAEKCRDHFEKHGRHLTATGILKLASSVGLSDNDAAALDRQLRDIFRDELKGAQATPAKAKPAKEKKTVTATATAPPAKSKKAKKTKKAKIAKKVAAKPSTNGHKPEGKTIIDATVKGVPVVLVETDTNKYRGTLFGVPIRNVMRLLGKLGWPANVVRTVIGGLLSRWKDGEQYAANLVQEGHVQVGAKGTGTFGAIPSLSKDQLAKLNALKKGL